MIAVFFAASRALAWVSNPSAWAFFFVVFAVVLARRPARAAAVATLGAVQLLAFSSPQVADALQGSVERSVPATYTPDRRYDAAIVLGGGEDRIERGAEVVRRGEGDAFLYTGRMSRAAEAALVAELRARGLDETQIVIGDQARNTHENAVEAAEIVARNGWQSLLLVTSAIHMPRAVGCFRRQGLEPDVLPVGVDGPRQPRGWRPTRAALDQSRALLHEVIGAVVYRVVGYSA